MRSLIPRLGGAGDEKSTGLEAPGPVLVRRGQPRAYLRHLARRARVPPRSQMSKAAALLALAGLALRPGAAGAAPPVGDGEGGIRLNPIGEFEQPVGVVGAPGLPGLTFIVERTGRILIVHKGRTMSRPFLDIEHLVACSTNDARRRGGLLGLAFPPDYARSRLLYVYYTDLEGDIRIDELRRSRRRPAWRCAPAGGRCSRSRTNEFRSHYGGQLFFRGRDALPLDRRRRWARRPPQPRPEPVLAAGQDPPHRAAPDAPRQALFGAPRQPVRRQARARRDLLPRPAQPVPHLAPRSRQRRATGW